MLAFAPVSLASKGLPAVFSIVIPVRDEGSESAERFALFARRPDVEIVVADGGGSRDACERFAALGARVVTAEGSRGAALAGAAREARGDVLLFFHADTTVSTDALDDAVAALDRGAVAGAFSLVFDDPAPAFRWIAWWANARARLLGLAFGDQGLFCRRADYERAGGFRDLPIGEDLDLARRLARLGRFVVLRTRAVTSARRYRDAGVLRQLLRNWRVEAGWFAGVPPNTLARWYRGERGSAPPGRPPDALTSPRRRG